MLRPMRASDPKLGWNKFTGLSTRAGADLAAQAERLATLWGALLAWSPRSKTSPPLAALFSRWGLPTDYKFYKRISRLIVVLIRKVMNENGN